MGKLCLQEPDYGTSSTAIERISADQPKYIRITDFGEFGIEKNHVFMTTEKYNDSHLLAKGDILFARTGASVGKTYIHCTSEVSVFAGYCIRFRLNPEIVIPKYVYWFTKTVFFKQWVLCIQRPSGQPNINKEEYKSFQIIVPPLELQKRFVYFMDHAEANMKSKLTQADELLSSMDEYVLDALGLQQDHTEKKTIYATRLSALKHSRYDTEYNNPHFTKKVELLKKLSHSTLDDIIEFSSESWNQEDYFDSHFPYIEISGVGLKTNEYEATITDISEAASRAKMIVRNGDIIVSTTRPHRGAIATISCEPDEIMIASTGFAVLRTLKREDITKEYLQWILLNNFILDQMLQRSSGGNYPAINIEELKKVVIPIPTKAVQWQIADEAVRRRTLARQLKEEAESEWRAAKAQFETELLGDTN